MPLEHPIRILPHIVVAIGEVCLPKVFDFVLLEVSSLLEYDVELGWVRVHTEFEA